MASGIRLVCTNCKKTIEAWPDGDPYYFDQNGKKQYVYHPDPVLELCVGYKSPHLCLNCGKEFTVDSEKPIANCPKSSSDDIVDTAVFNS